MVSVATIRGKPWVVEDEDFGDGEDALKKWMYCVRWSMLADAEYMCSSLPAMEEGEKEADFLVKLSTDGYVTLGASGQEMSSGRICLHLPWSGKAKWKAGSQVQISRSGPSEMLSQRIQVSGIEVNRLYVDMPSNLPENFAEGTWNIFPAANEIQLQRQLEAIFQFSAAPTNACQTLICAEPASSKEVARCNKVLAATDTKMNEVERIVFQKFPNLNGSQKQAILNSFTRHVCLIQGPPGTGKTLTAAAILSVNQAMTGIILAAAPSNEAADVLTVQVARNNTPVVRAGHCSNRKAEIVSRSPELLRENEMEQEKWCQKNGAAWKKHRSEALRTSLQNEDPVVVSTCGYANAAPVLAKQFYHFTLIDEAGQTAEPDANIPISRLTLDGRLALVGDHKQLAPIASNKSEESSWKRSLLERLHGVAGMDPLMLDMQYRMHIDIATWPSSHFYKKRLLTAPHLQQSQQQIRGFPWPSDSSICFVHADGYDTKIGNSYTNQQQIDIAKKIVQNLLATGDIKATEIAVLAPYDAARKELREAFSEQSPDEMLIDSVDKSQGSEKDIVVFVTVRGNRNHALGFLKDERRLNVAITRAKKGVIVIGHLQTLIHGDCFLLQIR